MKSLFTEVEAFELGRVLYEARIREAWGREADRRLASLPYPTHMGAERSAEVDLAIAQARAALKFWRGA